MYLPARMCQVEKAPIASRDCGEVNNESQQLIAALYYRMCQTKKMDPAGLVIVISLLKATAGKSQRVCQRGGTSEWEEKRGELAWKCGKRGISSDKERVPPFQKVLLQTTTQGQPRRGNRPRGVTVHWIYPHPSVNTVRPIPEGSCCGWRAWVGGGMVRSALWPLRYENVVSISCISEGPGLSYSPSGRAL